MTIRPLRPIMRTHASADVVPLVGFVVALAAGVLQAAWWFSHGWAWSSLPKFLMSGEPVAWCVILILAGATLSWMGLRRAGHRQRGREWAVAGLVISGLAAIPIMLGVLLIVLFLLLAGSVIGRCSGTGRRRHAVYGGNGSGRNTGGP